ncbi:MAG: ABC transporter ATP-binding protein [Thermoproteota archaeon]|nr:ABC transporter ATP-binding protein [Candidatus Brockarchaeota archaeon]
MKIKVVNLKKSYGKVKVLNGVSFEVPSGKLLALLGPSGAGKTTLLRIIAGLTKQDSGDVYFDDKNVNAVPPQKRNVGMVFQNLALFPNLTVKENIAYSLVARNISREKIESRVNEIVNMLELNGLEDRLPSQISGGQQQRVAIGRAIAPDVKLLLLDEPFTSLDLPLKDELVDLLKGIQRKLNVTTIYVTHDEYEAAVLSDYIATLIDGKIDCFNETFSVLSKPCSEKSAKLLGMSNILTVNVVSSENDYLFLKLGDYVFKVKMNKKVLDKDVKVLIRPNNLELSSESGFEATLEAVSLAKDYIQLKARLNSNKIKVYLDQIDKFYELKKLIGRRIKLKIKNCNLVSLVSTP